MARDQEEDVHHPPDSKPAQCQQLAHPGARQAETEPGKRIFNSLQLEFEAN